MKKLLLPFFLLAPVLAFSRASVAYYPFSSLFAVSTNPNRLVWVDGRLQTNTIFGLLSTTFCPMVNVSRTERTNYYVGAGVKITAINALNNDRILDGYSLHAGVRTAPAPSLPNLRVAFELSPYAGYNFKSGNFYSYLGVVWQF